MRKKGNHKSKLRTERELASGDALLMAFAGFLLSYIVAVPHVSPHMFHWALAGGSALFAYVSWRIWTAFKAR